MQSSFFNSALDLQDRAHDKMRQFDFDSALHLLAEAKAIDPYLPNVDFNIALATRCRNAGFSPASRGTDLVQIREELLRTQSERGRSVADDSEILKLIAHRLLALDEFNALNRLEIGDASVHEAACVLYEGRAEQAYLMLLDATEKFGDTTPARYWGYLGDAARTLEKHIDANIAYVRMLVTDPAAVDWTTFKHDDLRQTFEEQVEEQPTLDMAYATWPYAAWAQGLIDIPRGNEFIAPLVEKLDSGQSDFSLFDEPMRARLFNLHMFLEQSSRVKTPLPESRRRMKALNEQRFKEYLELSAKFV